MEPETLLPSCLSHPRHLTTSLVRRRPYSHYERAEGWVRLPEAIPEDPEEDSSYRKCKVIVARATGEVTTYTTTTRCQVAVHFMPPTSIFIYIPSDPRVTGCGKRWTLTTTGQRAQFRFVEDTRQLINSSQSPTQVLISRYEIKGKFPKSLISQAYGCDKLSSTKRTL